MFGAQSSCQDEFNIIQENVTEMPRKLRHYYNVLTSLRYMKGTFDLKGTLL